MVLIFAEIALASAFLVFWVMILILTVILDNKSIYKEAIKEELKAKSINEDTEEILQKK